MKLRNVIILAFSILIGLTAAASASYWYRDGNNALYQIWAFTCQGLQICPAQVLIDSSGAEKGTLANPVIVASGGSIAANQVRGSASSTTTAATTIIAAPAAGLNIYVTAIQCFATGSVSTTITFNDSATTVIVIDGHRNVIFPLPTPLVSTATATAFTFTAGIATSGITCNAQGYTGT